MAEESKGFGGQLFERLKGQGLSKSQVYKALTLQKLNEEVLEIAGRGNLGEGILLEIAKISGAARQKQLAEIAVAHTLSHVWVKELSRLLRSAEKAPTNAEANVLWDFFFEVKESLARDGATKELQQKIKGFGKKKAGGKGAGDGDLIEVEADRKVTDFKTLALEIGRGLDVGTTNICAAAQLVASGVVYNIQRNAFLDVRTDAFTKKMLLKLGIDHIVHGDRGYVIGDPAFELANIFEKNTRRPMRDGMISPVESEALLIVSLLIAELLGHPQQPGEICAFSIPADPIDAERNVIYHRGALEAVLRKLGYVSKPMLEGLSVVFAELIEQKYTGIGISCGGGMFNISIAYRSVPALTFSTSRGGDWIDNNVSSALGMPGSQICALKEGGVDLLRPKNRVEDAIAIYYRNLIHYTLKQIQEKFENAQNMPSFSQPIDLVCAGGTSMIGGFIDVFREEFEKIQFPIAIREIRLAKDPLRAVARGCLQAALEETRAIRTMDLPTDDVVHVSRAEVTQTSDIRSQMDRLARQKEGERSVTDRDEGRVAGRISESKPASVANRREEGAKVVGRLPDAKPPARPPQREEAKVVGRLPENRPAAAPSRDEGKVVGRLPQMRPAEMTPTREEGTVVGKIPPPPHSGETEIVPLDEVPVEEITDLEPVVPPEDESEPIEIDSLEEVTPARPKKKKDEDENRPDVPLIS